MITVGEEVYHFQLMMDEASSFAVVVYLFKHKVTEGRNATSEEILESLHLQSRWIQYFGYPQVQGDFIPAESHGMIGQVERGIGVLKDRMIRHLRPSEGDPTEARWTGPTFLVFGEFGRTDAEDIGDQNAGRDQLPEGNGGGQDFAGSEFTVKTW